MFKKRRIRKRAINWLRMMGCYVVVVLQDNFSDPDVMVCIHGRCMLIKFCRNSNKVKFGRYSWRERMLRMGGEVAFVAPDNFEMFKTRIRHILCEQ